MLQEFQGTPQQINLVTDLAEEAYRYVVQQPLKLLAYTPAHRGPFCVIISDFMIERLREVGFPAQPRDYFGVLRHRHIYLGNEWIADPTWQQRYHPSNLAKLRRLVLLRRTEPPRVLIAKIPKLPSLLSKYGVDHAWMPTWTEAEIREAGSKLF